jgi:hypothetical protein
MNVEGDSTWIFFSGDERLEFPGDGVGLADDGESASSFAAHRCSILLRSFLKHLSEEEGALVEIESETYLCAIAGSKSGKPISSSSD